MTAAIRCADHVWVQPAQAASAESSSLFCAFFLERIFLTHFDVVRSRFVVLSMPNADGKLPFPTAGDVTAERKLSCCRRLGGGKAL
jgi:hypothetical protein